MASPGWRSAATAIVASVWMAGLAVLAWQVLLLMFLVTFGPGAPKVPFPPWPDQYRAFVLASLSLVTTALLAPLLSTQRWRLDSDFTWQVGTAMVALAVSYRFPALLAFFWLVALRAVRASSRGTSWRIWAAVLMLSLSPIDVALRPRDSGMGLVPAEDCSTSQSVEKDARGSIVCVSSSMWLYSEPRWVWLW